MKKTSNTEIAFERMKRIWKGAEWSSFVRYCLGAGRREFIYGIMGDRGQSLTGDQGEHLGKYGKVPLTNFNSDDEIDLSGSPEVDQGRVGSCACSTLASIIQDAAVRQTKNNLIEIKWKPVWEDMKRMGLADDKNGSSLTDNLWYGQKYGFKDQYGNTWRIGTIEPILRGESEKYIRYGYQIYTGMRVNSPMCDKEWNLLFGKPSCGHCFRAIGIKGFVSNGIKIIKTLLETTWKDYGYKRESQFFTEFKNFSKFMSCYVMTVYKDE